MKFSKSSGTLVGTPSDVSVPILSGLFSRVPGEDPARSLRAFLCVRTDRLTEAETLQEMSAFMDLYGRVRLAGLTVSELEAHLTKEFGLGKSTVMPALAYRSGEPESRVSRLFDDLEVSVPKKAPVRKPVIRKVEEPVPVLALSNGSAAPAPAVLPSGWLVGQAFRSLTKDDFCRVVSIPEGPVTDKSRFQVKWNTSGALQDVTVKTLKDRRRYVALAS